MLVFCLAFAGVPLTILGLPGPMAGLPLLTQGRPCLSTTAPTPRDFPLPSATCSGIPVDLGLLSLSLNELPNWAVAQCEACARISGDSGDHVSNIRDHIMINCQASAATFQSTQLDTGSANKAEKHNPPARGRLTLGLLGLRTLGTQ
ncbi:hypothetical protein DFH08DRAFT_806209 [Mycena albidolilacea]|uniref:Uncharacterized protein n=1 Tax=Mycena albidolilacea TaxID=1033008 RepID=A0AAD7A7U9_9AGAR|nr:hypothetical protein DFH08DRAFT_806209 [Mycena albidolilacea]